MIEMISWGLTVVLAAIAAIHFYWAFGGLWPADNEPDLVRTVIGNAGRTRMPPVWMTGAVAVLLLAIAAWPLVLSGVATGLFGRSVMIAGSAVLVAVFVLRGIAGYVPAWRHIHAAEPFARLDRTRYSPLCLLLGAGFLILTLKEGGV